jgi:hypothetical protein
MGYFERAGAHFRRPEICQRPRNGDYIESFKEELGEGEVSPLKLGLFWLVTAPASRLPVWARSDG